jgi:hypothetical protein
MVFVQCSALAGVQRHRVQFAALRDECCELQLHMLTNNMRSDG